ncbi:MAG: class I SAM-dependent methyltransferase [Anaerolineae bacterium]|nr:class I SAM-dependent methyltransferase [Anaerolineae bacterium]
MQAYGPAFARVYNERWAFFAERVAPAIRAFYESTPGGADDRTLLDVCCGTGQLAAHLLAHGYRVTGIDLSPHMLRYARQNTAPYVARGAARFFEADAASFTVDGSFGLAVSTFDSLNHLPDREALRGCFGSVFALLRAGGFFVFDLNTRAGLRRWNGINVRDMHDALIIDRGVYDEDAGRAWVRITGFVRTQDGLYERFDQTAYNTAFDMAWVREALLSGGWRSVYFSQAEDLGMPIPSPESQDRVFVVARK